MLTVHHLGKSQSERILWLCEELGLDYALVRHTRDPVTIFSPPELRAVHPMGTAPVLVDGDVVMAESGAIMDYILARYAGGRLQVPPDDPAFPDYLYWLHFGNGSLQPVMGRNMIMRRLDLPADNPVLRSTQERLQRALGWLESRLTKVDHLAGDVFTAADIMMVFTLTTMRLFMPVDLAPYPGTRAYLARMGARPAYQAAMRKGDPDLTPMLA